MRVFILAAPLEGRSGVYRTTLDLVAEARSRGLEWSGLIGMRSFAPAPSLALGDGVEECVIHEHGFAGVREIQRKLEASDAFLAADVIVTLITQSDFAAASHAKRFGKRWVAFIRGMPWPVAGESSLTKRVVQRTVETAALARADAVWVTTEVLGREAGLLPRARIVPAGIPPAPRINYGEPREEQRAVWAGRFARDKQPDLFMAAARLSGIASTVYGAGPLDGVIRATAASNVVVHGWVSPHDLWSDAGMFVGTSYREAFGRSAAEAALHGIPVILGDAYGAAPLLIRDPELRKHLVLAPSDPLRWSCAMGELWNNADLRRAASSHVHANAQELTIAASVDRMLEELERLQ